MTKIIILQPALPTYRIDFFRRLASHFGSDIRVYYSPVDMGVLTAERDRFSWEHPIGTIVHPVPGIEWQVGALSVPFQRGDIVVVCGAPRTISTLLVLAKARLKGAKTIWWGHYWSATSKPHRQHLRMQLSRLADSLLFYCDAEVARFNADGWKHPGHLGALNNGLDLTEVRRLRRPYDPSERNKNLLFIGRISEKANLDLMVEALANPGLKECQLHVIGDGPEKKPLQAKAAALGVGGQIIWHGGSTDEVYISKVANHCAAFVYPGQVGLSLIHAMGYGLPSIVHNDPLHHMPEIAALCPGANGVTFARDDSGALASVVSNLFLESASIREMSAGATRTTLASFNTEDMARRFIALIDRLK